MKVQIIYTWFVSADEIQNWGAAVLWAGDKGEPLSNSTDPPQAGFDLFFSWLNLIYLNPAPICTDSLGNFPQNANSKFSESTFTCLILYTLHL